MMNYWESEEIFLDGDDYFDHLISDIDNSKDYITVEMYIFNQDSLGNKIATHLIAAHERGVKVEIMVDGIGSYFFFDNLHGKLSEKGIRVKMYHPLPFYHPILGEIPFNKKLNIFLERAGKLNSRNHRKIVTIDSKIMYTGSFNFTAEHTRFSSEKKWKDMGVRVTGENVKFAILHFKKIWRLRDYFKYRKEIKVTKSQRLKAKNSPLRLNHSLFMKRYYYKDLMRRIRGAKNRIWLTTPYFIPKRQLILSLGAAAAKGIDVRLLISSKSDVFFSQILQYFYYPYLIKKGVKIFQYTETILHAKNFIIDDWTTVGSSNLNHRSLLHDLEVDLVIQDDNNLCIIENNFTDSVKSLPMITIETLKQRSLFDKILGRVLFLFKYWF